MVERKGRADSIILEGDDVELIRRMLLIGLSSYGEIERLQNEQEIVEEIAGQPLKDELRVVHPTGSADTAGQFAAALLTLQCAHEAPTTPLARAA